MKLLIDSHALYWWMIGSNRLSKTARALIEDKQNAIFVSAITFYEIENKIRLRKLDLKPQELREAFSASGMQSLAITDLYAELAATLDWEHRDPWDRLLAAQARLEQCALVSIDKVFDDIPVERLW